MGLLQAFRCEIYSAGGVPCRHPYGLKIIESCLGCTSRASRFFCNLSPSALQAFEAIRFTNNYPRGSLLFLEGQPPRGVFVLCRGWRVYVPEDVPYLTDYFRTAFDFSPQNLGIFLEWLLPGNVGYQGSPIKFVEGFYSPASDIVARLKKAEQDGVEWSPEHAAAIQRFREFLEAEPESPPPAS